MTFSLEAVITFSPETEPPQMLSTKELIFLLSTGRVVLDNIRVVPKEDTA